MTINVFVAVAHLPSAPSRRLADPIAHMAGQANVTGDASGGAVNLGFMVPISLELSVVYVVDSISYLTGTTDPGNLAIRFDGHHEPSNPTLDLTRRTILNTSLSGAGFTVPSHQVDRWLQSRPIWWRINLGGSDAERTILVFGAQTNINLQIYEFRIYGRVYDARILSSPDFHKIWPAMGAPT